MSTNNGNRTFRVLTSLVLALVLLLDLRWACNVTFKAGSAHIFKGYIGSYRSTLVIYTGENFELLAVKDLSLASEVGYLYRDDFWLIVPLYYLKGSNLKEGVELQTGMESILAGGYLTAPSLSTEEVSKQVKLKLKLRENKLLGYIEIGYNVYNIAMLESEVRLKVDRYMLSYSGSEGLKYSYILDVPVDRTCGLIGEEYISLTERSPVLRESMVRDYEREVKQAFENRDFESVYKISLKILSDMRAEHTGLCEEIGDILENCANDDIRHLYVYVLGDRYVSLRGQHYIYSAGAAHGNTIPIGSNFDLNSCEPLKLSDIVKTSERDEFKELIFERLASSLGNALFISSPDELRLFPDEFSRYKYQGVTRPFWFSKLTLTLVFSEYEVAPYAAGTPNVTISIPEFKQLFRADFLKSLGY